jgi:hypothetical protein
MEGGAVRHNLKWDYSWIIPAKFGLIWFSGFREEEIWLGCFFGWSTFNIVSDSPALHSKWLLLLKIEMSLVVIFCF